MIKKMALGWIEVADSAKAKDFFVDVIGLTLTNSSPEWGWYELSGQQDGFLLGLSQKTEHNPIQAGRNAVITMSVDNIEEAVALLKAKGVTFIGDIIEVPGHVKMATFIDLDNNIFQLVQTISQ